MLFCWFDIAVVLVAVVVVDVVVVVVVVKAEYAVDFPARLLPMTGSMRH